MLFIYDYDCFIYLHMSEWAVIPILQHASKHPHIKAVILHVNLTAWFLFKSASTQTVCVQIFLD